MRDRRPDESWTEWAEDVVRLTEAELALTPDAWRELYGAHPGPGYTDTLNAQLRRMRREIVRARASDVL